MTKENKAFDSRSQTQSPEVGCEDPLGSLDEVTSQEIPAGVDRRTFLMRSASAVLPR